MNGQYNESIRREIRLAFHAEKEPNRNMIPDNLAEGGASQPVKIKDEDGVVIGQREITHAVATRPKGKSSCPLHDDAFAHARIVRSVNALPDHHKAAVFFCYVGNGTEWESVEMLANYVWARLSVFIDGWQRFNTSKLKPAKVQKLKALVFNAILHFREGAANCKKLYTLQILAGLMGISDANWRRDWAPFWNQMLTILTDLDAQALSIVGRESRARKAA